MEKDLGRKTSGNILFLTFRNLGIQAVSIVGFFLLTLILGPAEVGLFAIVAESVGILGYFSDLGLAAALIQQPQKITKKQLQTTFFIQQLLVLISIVTVSLIYNRISWQKNYGSKEFWIFTSLCFAYVSASLKTIPSVLLERKLNFQKISLVDISENMIFYFLAVVFAFFGFEGYSYAIATFVKSFFGLLFIYRLQSWSVGFYFSKSTAKSLFRFGLPFQLNSFIALAKDRLSNLFVASIIGRESFGILSWAQKGPRVPLSLMDAVIKVSFPTFSRIQHQQKLLSRSIVKTVYYIALFIFPALAGTALIAPDIIDLIPKYSRWRQAITPLYFFAFSYAIAAITTPLTNAFNAVGKIFVTTRFMVLWTILTWIFYPLLSYRFGYLGTAAASLIVGSSSFLVWLIANRTFSLNIFQTIFHPTVSTFLMILVIIFINPPLLIKIALSLFIYSLYHLIFSRPQLIWFRDQLLCHLPKKSSSL